MRIIIYHSKNENKIQVLPKALFKKVVQFLFLCSILFVTSCEEKVSTNMKHYSNYLLTGWGNLVVYEYYNEIPESEYNKENRNKYYEITYTDDNKIKSVKIFNKPWADPIITSDNKTLNEKDLNKIIPYSLSDYINYNYNSKGELETVETQNTKSELKYLNSIIASFTTYDKNKKQEITSGIIKFNDKGDPFLLYISSDGFPKSIGIYYLENRKIIELNLIENLYEKYDIEFRGKKIIKIKYSNSRGEAWERDESDGFFSHTIK